MKLNLNAKELLALHNLLYERYEASYDGKHYANEDPRASADVQLRQVYSRLKACVIAALSNRQLDPVDAYFTREQAKIDTLKDQNEELKKEPAGLAKQIADEFSLTKEDESYMEIAGYPRRPRGNRGKNNNGNKR